MRRRAVVDCPSLLPRGDGGVSCRVNFPVPGSRCSSDSDCADAGLGPRATCESTFACSPAGGGGGYFCGCTAGCVRDSDCPTSTICVCGDPIGHCVRATCASRSSCDPGCDCIDPITDRDRTFFHSFDCQTPPDKCAGSADCLSGFPCVDNGNGHACFDPATDVGRSCSVARAFLVRGHVRLAESAKRSDWMTSTGPTPDALALSARVRGGLAVHWARIGLMEHASIAAFARFVMHLLAAGAPPDLVRASQEAMGDETEHTRLAFALASTFEGRPLGPGPLSINGALDGFNVDEFVATLLREGCIGETMAAIEAHEALQGATDPAVRSVLSTLARDELRHAELAWRTLSWLLASERLDRERLRVQAARVLSEAPSAPCAVAAEEDLTSFGIVGAMRRFELRRLAITRVVEPCLLTLLSNCRASPTTA